MSTQGLTRVAALLAVLLWSTAGGAQTYPIKPVRIIVPYQAGQGTDVAARYQVVSFKSPADTPAIPNQGNNVYIFPAMAMALFVTEAKRVTEDMFLTAAQAIAEQVNEESLAAGLIYPPRERIFNASLHVAERVATCIFDHGLARVPRPDDVGALIRERAYRPVYSE